MQPSRLAIEPAPSAPAAPSRADEPILDRAFLARQCFGDRELEREVLQLFADGGTDLLAALPGMPACRQREAAHRLRGSCLGIGAAAMARAARAVEDAGADELGSALAALAAAFASVAEAIRLHLAAS